MSLMKNTFFTQELQALRTAHCFAAAYGISRYLTTKQLGIFEFTDALIRDADAYVVSNHKVFDLKEGHVSSLVYLVQCPYRGILIRVQNL